MGTVYATNDAKVISETLDGETIIIQLETGTYYSANATASAVWERVKAGAGLDEIVTALVRAYAVEDAEARAAARSFLDRLIADGLIVETDAPAAVVPEPASVAERAAFVAPALQTYDDMQQMLLADPIHDVDERGWPILKQP